MHINRLRLIGFKSFVEPTDLLIEKGLTGVVGPNGCGKSNLLEALRWVMGETSHKSMRAASMDDVIFNGTTARPPRNNAEVTIQIDNTDRKAPAEFNAHESLDVTRRIEREAGSAYRINGKEVRARDVRILFEDAATGARSPALVRQGQIAEIVNAKPEQRRRILEDAAGIAGLHSRRHEAELRLRAAEGNLARLNDILGQLNSQIESLKRQARQARRYKELSTEIRKLDAIVLHLRWVESQGQVESEEAGLSSALEKVGRATEAESKALRAEAEAAEQLQPLRDQEAAKGAILHRFKIEQENLEREAERNAERRRDLEARVEQLTRDRAREEALIAEGKETLARLEGELESLANTDKLAAEFESKALGAYDEFANALKAAETRLGEATTAAAEARAHRQSTEAQLRERKERVLKLERQLTALESQVREIVGRAPDASKLKATAEVGQQLMADIAAIEQQTLAAEAAVQAAAADAAAKGELAAEVGTGRGPAQDRGGDARQASEADRRQRPAARAGSHQGGVRIRAGARGSAGRRSGCTCALRSAGALVAQCRTRARPGAAGWRGAACSAGCSAAGTRAAAQADWRRAACGRHAAAASTQAGPTSGVGGGRPVALGRLRRGCPGRYCRGEPTAGAQPARDPCRPGGRSAPRR